MSNTSMEDLLAQSKAIVQKKHRSRIKEIIDAGIARIDSIMSNKAEEETSAKEAYTQFSSLNLKEWKGM
ncbi:hypothetical protein Tco_1039436 [Tanacetum coccineum]